MPIKNKLYKLSRSFSQANKNRNNILIGTFILAVFVIFSSFSIANGKIKADTMKNIRKSGTVSNACLKNADSAQYRKIKKLSYIEKAGREKVFAYCYEDNSIESTCVVLDKTEWNEIRKPAYGEVTGTYPAEADQVMLSMRHLKKWGIDNPEIGMDISVSMVYDDWAIGKGEEENQTFILSGYYADYLDEAEGESVLYFSEKLMKQKGLSWEKSDISIKLKDSIWSGAVLEAQLYNDIEVEDNQQIIASDSAGYTAVEQFAGGYAAAFLCGAVMLLSAYMIINNVLCISMNKEIRQYGLLSAIGATPRQIRAIMRYQLLEIWEKGSLLSILLCIVVGILGLPVLVKTLYMQETGTLGISQVFSVKIILFSLLFTSLMLIAANRRSGTLLKKMSPAEAYRFVDASAESPKRIKKHRKYSEKGISLFQLAKRNVLCSPKRFWLIIISLFLGCEVAVMAIFVGTGADMTNQLKRNPDIIIGTNKKAVENYLFEGTEEDLSKELFTKDFLSKIQKISYIEKKSIQVTYGCYSSLDLDEAALAPRGKGAVDVKYLNTSATIQVISDSDIKNIEQYVIRNGLKVDIEAVRSGTGALVLHKHELSQSQEEWADKLIGLPIYFYNYEEKDKEPVVTEFVNSGYIDITGKGFPELYTTWLEKGTNYFVVSESGLSRFNTLQQPFSIRFNAKKGKESILKSSLISLIQSENQNSQNGKVYYITSNSDIIKKFNTYIMATKIIMVTLGMILLFMGFVNYINTIITSYIERKREFATMHSIGMTEKQLKKMLLYEGRIYALSLWGLLLTVGNLILVLLYFIIKNQLAYFTFIYPWSMQLFIILGIYLICTVVPKILICKLHLGN